MNALETTYCIDTSALIDLKKWYSWVTFPTLWGKIGNLIKQGRLIAPQQVLKEIEKKDDELLKWLKKHKKMFRALDQQQVDRAKDILNKFPDLIDSEKEIPDADPFVIAVALQEKDALYLFKHKCVVITQEKFSRGGKPKIPDVCKEYEIECISLVQLFREESWKF